MKREESKPKPPPPKLPPVDPGLSNTLERGEREPKRKK